MQATRRLAALIALIAMLTLRPLNAQQTTHQTDDAAASSTVVPQAIDKAKAPRLIMIVRHAEKPEKALHSPDLTETGKLRAGRIPSLFTGSSPAFPRPDFLFATAVSKGSRRPIETLTPLSQALGEPLNIAFGQGDAVALAQEVLGGRYAGKVVLICWHHGEIPQLAADLGVNQPPAWMGETFDQVWSIRYDNGAARMSSASEMLLPGDRPGLPPSPTGSAPERP